MIRTHNKDLAKRERDNREIAATLRFTVHSDRWYCEMALLELEEIVASGLWSCYSCFEDYLTDFYAGFGPDNAVKQMVKLMELPRFLVVAEKIQNEFGFDLAEDLDRSIREWGE